MDFTKRRDTVDDELECHDNPLNETRNPDVPTEMEDLELDLYIMMNTDISMRT